MMRQRRPPILQTRRVESLLVRLKEKKDGLKVMSNLLFVHDFGSATCKSHENTT